MTSPYEFGEVVTLDFTVSVGGVLTDPTTISLIIQDPAAVVTTFTPVHDSTGTYHYSYVPTLAGLHRYRWVTTGVGQAAEEGSFLVSPLFGASVAFQPSPDQVHALIAQRPAFTTTSKPSLAEVQSLIDMRTADLLGELAGADVPLNLFGLAQRTIALGVAADIESGYFPEQQLGDSQHASLTARYLQALTRFQQLLAEQGGGPLRIGTSRSAGSTLTAWNEQATALGLNNPTLWPDAWYYGY
jgi:hypothetical protein